VVLQASYCRDKQPDSGNNWGIGAGRIAMLTTDYLIIGSGTAGMSFADQLLTDTNATIGIIDRHHMPGGHWNDAYSFVRLHQPSAFYGVGSRQLGSNRIDVSSLNRGYYELASGPEIVSYFDRLMQERFLPSGRVQYFRCVTIWETDDSFPSSRAQSSRSRLARDSCTLRS
jgi:NAD(P)-binding Rossmann-like domain